MTGCVATIDIIVQSPVQVEVAVAGTSGASAYTIALLNGFVGTEAEWLASLKGDTGTSEMLWNTTNW
jgi:hypothetical protein